MRTEAVLLINVRKAFDSLVAVSDVSLTVHQGEI
jgi:ABC-type uncharacterized transport system ATPase subunit